MYQISDTDFVQTLKEYENHKMQLCIYKAVVDIWSFLFLGTNGVFFSLNFWLHILLSVKLELVINLLLKLSKGPFFFFSKEFLVIVVIVVYFLTIYYYAVNFLCLKMIKICTIILSYPEENQTPFLAQ